MIETIFSVILGAIVSWMITHWYYRKQEKTSPAPLIREINDKIQKIYDLSIVKKDRELQNKVRDLAKLISIASHRIIYALLPLDIDTHGLYEVYKSGDNRKFDEYLNEVLPSLFKFHEKVETVVKELESLRDMTEKLAEKDEGNYEIDGG